MDTPAISGIDATGRLVAFINGQLVHVPLMSVLEVQTVIDALDGVVANTTSVVPAGWAIDNVYIINTTANAVTVKIGTTAGASDVALIDVAANAILDSFQSLDWNIQKRLFSTTLDQTLYIQSTAWGSSSLNIRIKRTKIF